MTDIKIEHKIYTDIKTVTGFRVEIQELQLFKYVIIRVELLNAEDSVIKMDFVRLEGDDYANWNNDDNYIVQKVAEKLGMIILG